MEISGNIFHTCFNYVSKCVKLINFIERMRRHLIECLCRTEALSRLGRSNNTIKGNWNKHISYIFQWFEMLTCYVLLTLSTVDKELSTDLQTESYSEKSVSVYRNFHIIILITRLNISYATCFLSTSNNSFGKCNYEFVFYLHGLSIYYSFKRDRLAAEAH